MSAFKEGAKVAVLGGGLAAVGAAGAVLTAGMAPAAVVTAIAIYAGIKLASGAAMGMLKTTYIFNLQWAHNLLQVVVTPKAGDIILVKAWNFNKFYALKHPQQAYRHAPAAFTKAEVGIVVDDGTRY